MIHSFHSSMTRVRSRKWFGTVWDERDLLVVKGYEKRAQFIIISALDQTAEEHEGVRRDHWHVFIQSVTQLARPKTATAHWEIPRSVTGAVNYCKEKGVPVLMAGQLNLDRKNTVDWSAFKEACKTMTPRELIDSEYSKLYAHNMRFADCVHDHFSTPKIIDGELRNLWLWGDAGSGKTSWAWENFPELYVKNANKWWDSYNDQPVVLIDDLDPARAQYLVCNIKHWADRYPFQAECKGSSRLIRP